MNEYEQIVSRIESLNVANPSEFQEDQLVELLPNIPPLYIDIVMNGVDDVDEWVAKIVPSGIRQPNSHAWLREFGLKFPGKDKEYYWYQFERTIFVLRQKQDSGRAVRWELLFLALKAKILEQVRCSNVIAKAMYEQLEQSTSLGAMVDILRLAGPESA